MAASARIAQPRRHRRGKDGPGAAGEGLDTEHQTETNGRGKPPFRGTLVLSLLLPDRTRHGIALDVFAFGKTREWPTWFLEA